MSYFAVFINTKFISIYSYLILSLLFEIMINLLKNNLIVKFLEKKTSPWVQG